MPTLDGQARAEERSFADLASAAEALAGALAERLRVAIAERGQGVIAVSGGRTPALVFKRLRARYVDWARVTVTLTDERWVPETHPQSNAGLVRQHLLTGTAAAARFVPLYGGEESAVLGLEACRARLSSLPLPLDAVYLGMGEDGHFASLFPNGPEIECAEGPCVAVPAAKDRVQRMSLTAPTLVASRAVYLLYSGTAKHGRYLAAKAPGSVRELPLRRLLQSPDVNLMVLRAP